MKKIINNLLYNTDTAPAIGSWTNGLYSGDLDYVRLTLHRKRQTGEFFLHGEGGPRTRYAVQVGNNSWESGENVTPMTDDAAREWAEEHLKPEEYNRAFGEAGEDDGYVLCNFRLLAEDKDKLQRAAKERGVTMTALLTELIRGLPSAEDPDNA